MMQASFGFLVVAVLAAGCGSKSAGTAAASASAASKGDAATSAAPGASARGGEKGPGEATVTWSMGKMKDKSFKLAAAHAYIGGTKESPTLTVKLFSDGIPDTKECGAEVKNFGKGITADQIAFELVTSGVNTVPFSNKPGKIEKMGYTVYYYFADDKAGTNSGNGPGKDGSTLEITKLNDKVLSGHYVLKGDRDDISITFHAKVCANAPAEPEPQPE